MAKPKLDQEFLKENSIEKLVNSFASSAELYSVVLDINGKPLINPVGPAPYLGEFGLPAVVMGNLMLAARSLGLGSIWIHRAKEEFEQEEWKQFLSGLGITGEWEGIGHCAVGFPAGDIPPAAPRRDGRVFWAE